MDMAAHHQRAKQLSINLSFLINIFDVFFNLLTSELIAAFVKTCKDISSMQNKSIFCVHVQVEIKQSSQYSIHINNPTPLPSPPLQTAINRRVPPPPPIETV